MNESTGKARDWKGLREEHNVELCGINTNIKPLHSEYGQKALTVKPYSCWLSLYCKYLIIQLINPNIVSIRNNRSQWPCIDNFKPFQSYEFSNHDEMSHWATHERLHISAFISRNAKCIWWFAYFQAEKRPNLLFKIVSFFLFINHRLNTQHNSYIFFAKHKLTASQNAPIIKCNTIYGVTF